MSRLPGGPFLLLLAAALLCACPTPREKADSGGGGGIPPEERFGNDPELLADFANLKACTYAKGRLDHACPQVITLKLRLETKRRTPSRRKKMITTLANLLESRREVSRLMAAESLYPVRKERLVVEALREALIRETVPTIKAVMLRQICWSPGPFAEKAALALVGAANPAAVRSQAAACLEHLPKLSASSGKALVAVLSGKAPEGVIGAACAAAGKHRVAAAVAPMAALLERPKLGWRCAPALAAVGGKAAYKALFKATTGALGQGKVPAPYISALGSFAGEKFFNREAAILLLEQVVARKGISELALLRAQEELKRLKGKTE